MMDGFSSRQWVVRVARLGLAAALLHVGGAPVLASSSTVDGSPGQVSVAFSPRGEALATILGEIEKSRKRIDVSMFYISNDDLVDALCYQASKKRVKVRLMVDEYMNTAAHLPTLEKLVDHRVDVHVEKLASLGKLHLKCAVFDGETVVTGSANWTEYAFEQNFEDSVIIRSRPLAEAYLARFDALVEEGTDALYADYSKASRERVDDFPDIEEGRKSGKDGFAALEKKDFSDVRSIRLFLTPGRDGIRQLLQQMESARQVDIGMYMLSDADTAAAIAAIAREGHTRIRMLVDGVMLTGSLLTVLQELADAGVEIRYLEDSNRSLHLKTTVIDEAYLWTGSANWSSGAFEKNVEDMVMFESVTMAQHYRRFLDGVAEVCTPFDRIDLAAALEGPVDGPLDVATEPRGAGPFVGLPATGPRTNFTGTLSRRAVERFEVEASVEYLDDGEYLQALVKTIDSAQQSILISMFHVPVEVRETRQEAIERVLSRLVAAVQRGVYVYMVLEIPFSSNDSMHAAHSRLAERLRRKGVDVRLSVPGVPLHEKFVVVDLCKVLVGSHNWSEGALTGQRVYESSAYLVLKHQDFRLAEHILSRNVVSDMSSRDAWEKEITVLRHVAAQRGPEQAALIERLEKGRMP